MSSLIKKAVVSEKSFQDAASGKYTFIVDRSAEKNAVARECEELFKVKVLSVNSMNYQGKIKLTKRVRGKRSNYKKVVLTLLPGNKIDLFEIESDKAPTLQSESRPESVGKDKKEAKKEKKVAENKNVEVKIKESKK